MWTFFITTHPMEWEPLQGRPNLFVLSLSSPTSPSHKENPELWNSSLQSGGVCSPREVLRQSASAGFPSSGPISPEPLGRQVLSTYGHLPGVACSICISLSLLFPSGGLWLPGTSTFLRVA